MMTRVLSAFVRGRISFLTGIIGIFALAITLFATAHAQEPKKLLAAAASAAPVVSKATTPACTHGLTSTDLEAFIDGLMPTQLEREDIAGAVFAIVKDGKILFAKRYTPLLPGEPVFGTVSQTNG